MRRVLLPIVLAGAAAACGQFLAEEGSGTSPGSSSGGVDDAGGEASSSGEVDGASGESDGAVADAPYVPTPCTAKFCSPFDDEVAAFPFNWDRVGPSAGATAGLLGTRSDAFVSGPRALRVVTTSTSPPEQWLEKSFDTAATGSIQLAMRVDSVAGPITSLQFLALNCDDGGDAARVYLEPDRKLSLMTADQSFTGQTSVAVPFKSWVGLRVDFTYDGGTNVVSKLTFAGATTTPIVFDNCGPPFKVRLGATLGVRGPFDVSFDDVAIDWSP